MMAKIRAEGGDVTIRSYSLAIRGFLKNHMLDAALEQVRDMQRRGLTVPPALESIATAGAAQSMEELMSSMERRLGLAPTPPLREILISGHAMAGDVAKVDSIMAQIRAEGRTVTLRSYALAIKGYLKNQMLDAALEQVRELKRQGLLVPQFAVEELCNEASRCGGVERVLQLLQEEGIKLSLDALETLSCHCEEHRDVALAHRVEAVARTLKAPFSIMTYGALLRLYSSAGDSGALVLFTDMQKSGIPIGSALCITLLERCADARFFRLVEEIVAHASRQSGGMAVAVRRSALSAYAACGANDVPYDF